MCTYLQELSIQLHHVRLICSDLRHLQFIRRSFLVFMSYSEFMMCMITLAHEGRPELQTPGKQDMQVPYQISEEDRYEDPGCFQGGDNISPFPEPGFRLFQETSPRSTLETAPTNPICLEHSTWGAYPLLTCRTHSTRPQIMRISALKVSSRLLLVVLVCMGREHNGRPRVQHWKSSAQFQADERVRFRL